MVTLKELVSLTPLTGASDMEIIKSFFVQNDLEEEGMDLIHELTKSKIEKLNRNLRRAQSEIPTLPSKYLYLNYDLETANWLHKLELNYLVNGGDGLNKQFLEWAEENVPNIEQPKIYYFPLVDWLEEKGIKFKERKVKGKYE